MKGQTWDHGKVRASEKVLVERKDRSLAQDRDHVSVMFANFPLRVHVNVKP